MSKTSKPLSERQRNILKFIADYMTANLRPPTIREIGTDVDISSTSVVNYNLTKLNERGFLFRDKEVSRGLRLTDKGYSLLGLAVPGSRNTMRLPLLGNITAGGPIPVPEGDFAIYDEDDMLEFSETMVGSNSSDLFCLRVSGDSMIDAMVNDGDIVVLRKQSEARNGDMVAAVIMPDETTTLKHYYLEGDRVRLQPANRTMEPIFVPKENVQIAGKVQMVVRQP